MSKPLADSIHIRAEEMADMLARALKQAHDEEGVCSCWPGPCRLGAYEAWKKKRAKQRAAQFDGQEAPDA